MLPEKNNVITHEQIDVFFAGSDRWMRVIKVECGYKDKQGDVYYRDEEGVKRIMKLDFKPFLWARQDTCRKLYGGDRRKVIDLLSEYQIECFGLRTTNNEGYAPERMANGYNVMFRAQVPMSMERFQEFFIKGGRPIYRDEDDPEYECRDYIMVSATEQLMIEYGMHPFKGYEDYDDLVRLTYDLETTGLNPKVDTIDQIGMRSNKGFKEIIPVANEPGDARTNEFNAICRAFSIIREIDPDVITGHNVENFDWNFFDVRSVFHGTTMSRLSRSIIGKSIYKKKKSKVLKLGGEMEWYHPTIMSGVNMTDSLHAVRRAMAIDSNMKSARLKYVCQYSKIKTPNRVYVPGNKIGDIYRDTLRRYAYNDLDGEWFRVTKEMMARPFPVDLDENGEPVKVPIITPMLYTYNRDEFKLTNNKTGTVYDTVTGRFIVERYLEDDLYEGDKVELQYNQPNFLVTKMLPVNFDKVATMGTAAIWKYIMLGWSYDHKLAIPRLIDTYKFTGGLSRLLCVGYVDRIVKLDYNSLYPAIILSFAIKSEIDILGVMNTMLEYVLTKREYYKGLKGDFGKKADKLINDIKNKIVEKTKKIDELIFFYEKEKIKNDKLQHPFKIFGNGYFGSYGSGPVFPWSDLVCAEMTTCIGRQCLRLMISHFSENIRHFMNAEKTANLFGQEYCYRPIVGDTDGFNFQMPENQYFRYTDEHPYISPGRGRNTVKGKAYTKVDADVAEFEDLYLCAPYIKGINKMGLGIDEYAESTINFSRKNYADNFGNGKVKLVGNSIKSKKMSKYIENFLNEGIRRLLNNDGQGFLQGYYDYIDKIYNMRIPIKDIASVGKIKKTLEEYKADCAKPNSDGSKKSRQAWYELAIREGLDVKMGDTIYYINIGKNKGTGDVKRTSVYYVMGPNGRKIYTVYDDKGNEIVDRRGKPKSLTSHIQGLYKKFREANKGNDAVLKQFRNAFEYGRTVMNGLMEEDKLDFNCVLVPNSILEDEEQEHYCDENLEYNRAKYIDMFNKRITPLLVCFDRKMRSVINEKGKEVSNILISDPKDRKTFTEEESVLVSGQPFLESDQDTYEQLMTMEDKEIKFWLSVGKKPPYTEECGMDWETIKREYQERNDRLNSEEMKAETETYNRILENFTVKQWKKLIGDYTLPEELYRFAYHDVKTGEIRSIKHDVRFGILTDFLERHTISDDDDDEEEGE